MTTVLFTYYAPFISDTTIIEISFDSSPDEDNEAYLCIEYDNQEQFNARESMNMDFYATLEDALKNIIYDIAWTAQHYEATDPELVEFIAKAEARAC
jgi:radical SAM superfamily enzyme YgiQ (UPF0313 family)